MRFTLVLHFGLKPGQSPQRLTGAIRKTHTIALERSCEALQLFVRPAPFIAWEGGAIKARLMKELGGK